jgi:hypothetical protein
MRAEYLESITLGGNKIINSSTQFEKESSSVTICIWSPTALLTLLFSFQLPFMQPVFFSRPPSGTAYLYSTFSTSFISATSSIQHFHHTEHRTPLGSNMGRRCRRAECYCISPNIHDVPFGLCSRLSSFIAQNKIQIIILFTNILYMKFTRS